MITGGFWLAAIMLIAYLADLLAGDPEWLPHPVRWIGRLIEYVEAFLRAGGLSGRAGGVLLTVTVVGATYLSSLAVLFVISKVSILLYFLLNIVLAWTTLSTSSLSREASMVMRELKAGSLEGARGRLSRIVGRETAGLSKGAVSRAVVETVSENTSDGVIAPLFFMAIGGVPLALAYKAVNTLDSMVGYRDERYRDFGWFSARLDDAANFIPARITAALMVVSSLFLGFDWRSSLRVVIADGRRHASPNAGLPEAAVAGAVGVRLGGDATYGGVLYKKPHIGSGRISSAAVGSAILIMHLTGLIMLSGSAVLLALFGN